MSPASTTDAAGVTLETRRAIRLVARIGAAAVAVYLSMGLLVYGDAPLAIVGRGGEMELVAGRVDDFDRARAWGDRPVVFVVGSSIARESFDEAWLRRDLLDRGLDVGVEKFAFPSGTPAFTQTLARRLPLRPGDVVVTTVAYTNFRRAWLQNNGGFATYLQRLTDADDLWAMTSLPVANRLEYTLASAPPRGFHQHRAAFRRGLERTRNHWLGRPAPSARLRAPNEPATRTRFIKGFRTDERAERLGITDENLELEPGQVNVDALAHLVERVEAAGAVLRVALVPHHPEYYERGLIDPATVERFRAWMRADLGARYLEMPLLSGSHYMDYKHPNRDGRVVLSQVLADDLVEVLAPR